MAGKKDFAERPSAPWLEWVTTSDNRRVRNKCYDPKHPKVKGMRQVSPATSTRIPEPMGNHPADNSNPTIVKELDEAADALEDNESLSCSVAPNDHGGITMNGTGVLDDYAMDIIPIDTAETRNGDQYGIYKASVTRNGEFISGNDYLEIGETSDWWLSEAKGEEFFSVWGDDFDRYEGIDMIDNLMNERGENSSTWESDSREGIKFDDEYGQQITISPAGTNADWTGATWGDEPWDGYKVAVSRTFYDGDGNLIEDEYTEVCTKRDLKEKFNKIMDKPFPKGSKMNP